MIIEEAIYDINYPAKARVYQMLLSAWYSLVFAVVSTCRNALDERRYTVLIYYFHDD